ncbi:Acylphosphate phosphohydrolase, putative [hydrothermal vent metagenome]|uniref:Acylphosphate phosphohydrolase, putative n=1 Tax=hydrothermal vent metagenome TaxID=652676 RepID=A0A3B1DBX5_9ZZZZ
MIQAHIFYSGLVQGVGFRHTVNHLAEALDLTGWVRNLSDGRVEVLVEGTHDQIGQFCHNIEDHFPGYIRNKAIDYQEAQGTFEDFIIIL